MKVWIHVARLEEPKGIRQKIHGASVGLKLGTAGENGKAIAVVISKK